MSRDPTKLLLVVVAVAVAALAAAAVLYWWSSDPSEAQTAGDPVREPPAVPATDPASTFRTELTDSSRKPVDDQPTPERKLPGHAIPVRLQGRVLDAVSGRPIAAVVISAGGEPVSETGEDGRYLARFPMLSYRTTVRADHRDYLGTTGVLANHRVPRDGHVGDFDFELMPGSAAATLSGRVVDDRRTSVEGAEVMLQPSPPTQMGALIELPGFRATTAEDGGFAFRGLAPGSYDLTIAAAGFADFDRFGIALPRASRTDLGVLVVEPYAWSGLSGTVRDAAGKPIAGAELWVGQPVRKRAQAKSAADGSFRFDRLHPGRFYTGIQTPGGYTDIVQLEFAAGRVTRQEFRVPGGAGVVGGRVRIGGSPAIGLQVTAARNDTDSFGWRTRTDSDGAFRLEGLPADEVHLSFYQEEPHVSLDAPKTAVGRTDHVFDFPAQDLVEVRGTVRDALGTVLCGVTVAPPIPAGPESRAVTEADGTYRLKMSVTSESSHALVAEHSDYLPGNAILSRNMRDESGVIIRDITLHRRSGTGTVEGTVQCGGRPVRGVLVVCRSSASRTRWRAWTDSRGWFRLASVIPGEIELFVTRSRRRPMSARKIGILEPGGGLSPTVEIPEERRFDRTVQVVGEAGQPIAGAKVEAWTEFGLHLDDDMTSAAGTARLRDLPAGLARVSVRMRRHARQEIRHRVAGERTDPIVFRLVRGVGSIRGQVLSAGGRPLGQVEVTVENGASPGPRIYAITATDDSGHFAVEHLPTGVHTLTVWTSDGSKKTEVEADGREVRIVID